MRQTRNSSLLLIASLTFLGQLPAQQIGTVPVVIQVSDQTGGKVPHALVRVVPAPNAAAKMETDETGQMPLTLKPGGYAVFVRAPGFAPEAVHMGVVDEGVPNVDMTSPRRAQTFPIILLVATTRTPAISPSSPKDGLLVSAAPYHDPVGYSFADLKAMPHVKVTFHNAHTNADES